MSNCRVCHAPIQAFMSFGKMPIANGFLAKEELSNEYFFELAPAFCEKCCTFQIVTQPNPSQMFHANYAFFSQTSQRMCNHFKKLSQLIQDKYLATQDPFVVELGSNDGILLKNFKDNNIKHLGVEPSGNVAKVAIENGISTLCDFFSDTLAERIKQQYGQADIITSSNVMCHIPDINQVAQGIQTLLKPTGFLIFEDPYLGDVIEKTSYDQIYDEHVFLFSLHSVSHIFSRYDLELVNIEPLQTHGGSMRYFLAHKGKYPISDAVKTQMVYEKSIGLDQAKTFDTFRTNCEKSKQELVTLLESLKQKGKTVVGYAATSKSTTVLNYCKIGPNHIAYICDTTPIKHHTLSPGMHIPIVPHEEFKKTYPDYAVLFGWNHALEIFEKEQAFLDNGGQWILFVPEVKLMEQIASV